MSYSPNNNGAIHTDTDVALNNPATGQVLGYNASLGKWQNQTSVGTNATTSAPGLVQLAGDLAGTATAPTVAKINGVSISGTPATGQSIVATSGTTAAWTTQSASATIDGGTP